MANMTKNTFKDLVSAYGADPARWPIETRSDAIAFAATPEGQDIVRAEASLDTILNQMPDAPTVSDAYLNKLHAARTTTEPSMLSRLRSALPDIAPWLNPKSLMAQSSALAASLMLGLWVGGQSAAADQTAFEEELEYIELFHASDEDLTSDEDTFIGEAP